MKNYTYIVVGAGTAGCVLAARLTEDPGVSVLLLEAGSNERPDDGQTAADLWGTRFDWAFHSTRQAGLGNVTVPVPRGRTLGGSSTTNYSFHVRGHRSSYDRWAEAAGSGWGADQLLPYFRRSEQTTGTDPEWRGATGPMVIEPPVQLSQDAFYGAVQAAAENAGYSNLLDGNGSETEGIAPTELNRVKGARQSAADAYLRPVLHRPNLTVATGATARRLVIDNRRCVAVEYLADGHNRSARADREVVLCAGAVGSPHLLQLSGIGAGQHLRDAGIEVVHDLPGVGQNLQDHPFAHVGFSTVAPVTVGSPNPPRILTRTSADVDPDLQLLAIPRLYSLRSADADFEPWGSASWASPTGNGYSMVFSLMRPHSRGSVLLAEADPDSPPLIDLGFYRDPHDLDRMVAGLQIALSIGYSDPLAAWHQQARSVTHPLGTMAEMREYVRLATGSYFHLAGTCAMGMDSQAVVDPQLRVHGLQGIRVADASVMPSLPSGNTNASVLAIAERAAELIPD